MGFCKKYAHKKAVFDSVMSVAMQTDVDLSASTPLCRIPGLVPVQVAHVTPIGNGGPDAAEIRAKRAINSRFGNACTRSESIRHCRIMGW